MKAIRRRKGMQFLILVSYSFSNKKGTGFGRTTQFSTDRRVVSKSELVEMQDAIAKENNFDNVAILSYQFMT